MNFRRFTSVSHTLLACLMLVISQTGFATSSDIPEPLQPWVDWVKQDNFHCIHLPSGNDDERVCTLAQSTVMTVGAKAIQFKTTVTNLRDAWVALPGDPRQWPESLLVNDTPRAVIAKNGRPSIWLKKGNHTLSLTIKRNNKGNLQLPEIYPAITVLDETQQPLVAFRDNKNRLSFGKERQQDENATPSVDASDIKVFRHLIDGVWPQLQTRIELKISGTERILELPDAAYPGAIPYRIRSKLTHSTAADGKLKLIVKPGKWVVEIDARFDAPLQQWSVNAPSNANWPTSEYWSLSKSPEYISEIKSGTYAETSAIGAPARWQHLPWYRLGEGAVALELSRKPNESKTVEPETRIERNVWLPISGNQITVVDQINGQLPGHLAMVNEAPSAIYINDDPMPLLDLPEGIGTRFSGTSINGKVIWTQENVGQSLSLTTQPYDNIGTQSVNTVLHLPPGWTFLGTDSGHTYSGWLASWNLLSFFLVLVTSLGIYKLVGRAVGVIAFVLLTLGHDVIVVSSVPWLIAGGIAALLPRLVTSHWKKPLASLLVLIMVGACVDVFTNTREAIHPELSWSANFHQPYRANVAMESMPAPQAARMMSKSAEMYDMAESLIREEDAYAGSPPPKEIKLTDDGLIRAVGNSAPEWQGDTVRITQGITELNKNMPTTVYLLSPVLSTVYHLSIALLVLTLGSLILMKAFNFNIRPKSLKALLGTGVILLFSGNASAEMPSAELLDELREQVNQAAPCHPHCSAILSAVAKINDSDKTVALTFTVSNNSDKPVLTALIRQPDFRSLAINGTRNERGEPVALVFENDSIWVNSVPGQSDITLELTLAGDKANLTLATHQTAVRVQQHPSWKLSVSHQNERTAGLFIEHARHSPHQQEKGLSLPPSDFTALFDIQRELVMSDQWLIASSVKQIANSPKPGVVEIPKLAGEKLITVNPDIEDTDTAFKITLRGQRGVSWESTLQPVDRMTLPVPAHPQKTQWSIRHTPSWIINSETHSQASSLGNGELKRFFAKPSESITVETQKPRGIEGESIAITSLKTVNEVASDILTTTGHIRGETSKPKTLVIQPDGSGNVKSINLNGAAVSVDSSKTPDGYRIPLPVGQFNLEITTEEFRDFGNIETLKTFKLTDENDTTLLPGTATMRASISNNHWIWHTSSAGVGPVVVFWGIVLPVIVFALMLGLSRLGKMGVISWSLILLGLTYATPVSLWLAVSATILFVAWVTFLDYRNTHPLQRLGDTRVQKISFTLKQVGFVFFTLLAAGILLEAVANGLIGNSQTQILGNASSRSMMQWVNDGAYNQVTIYSLPVLIYRGLVMAWAIWLAVKVGTKFGPYAWSAFNNVRDLRDQTEIDAK